MKTTISNAAAIQLYPDVDQRGFQMWIKRYFDEKWSIEISTADFDKFWYSEIGKRIAVSGGFLISIQSQSMSGTTTLDYYFEVATSNDGEIAFEFISDFPGDLLGDYGFESPVIESDAASN